MIANITIGAISGVVDEVSTVQPNETLLRFIQ